LQTIADALGVSRMTVSNAFSRPDQLSADLRAQVLAVAERLGYVGPNPAARALARGRVGNVGLLLSESLNYALTDHVAVAFLAAIADEMGPTGRALTLLPSVDEDEFVPARDIAMDGAVVYSCIPDSPDVRWLVKRKLPLVFVDNMGPRGYPTVTIDDRDGARAAAQHLIDLGHREIAIVSNGVEGEFGLLDDIPDDQASYPERERLHGWREALTAAGIRPVIIRTLHGDPVTAGADAGRDLFARSPQPTGVLCFSDAIASGVLRAARDAGLSVPADVSVVGFDDSPLARQLNPELTTVRQDVTAKGRAAAAALMQQIDPLAKARGKKHVVLPTELIVRSSTARALHTARRG
jgi:DNA-binding LacI/PurR family transcriptional regulator